MGNQERKISSAMIWKVLDEFSSLRSLPCSWSGQFAHGCWEGPGQAQILKFRFCGDENLGYYLVICPGAEKGQNNERRRKRTFSPSWWENKRGKSALQWFGKFWMNFPVWDPFFSPNVHMDGGKDQVWLKISLWGWKSWILFGLSVEVLEAGDIEQIKKKRLAREEKNKK